MASMTNSLREFYDLERVYLDERIDALSEKFPSMKYRDILYDAIIIPKPTKPISNKDQFVIDQYIMNGGKVLWLVDPMIADMDSLITQRAGRFLYLRI